MADGITLNVTGLGDILGGLEQAGVRVRTAGQMAMYDTVRATYDGSQEACPVETGTLRDSGAMEVGDLSGSVTYSAPYALFVEEGHHTRSGSWVEPQHFLLNA